MGRRASEGQEEAQGNFGSGRTAHQAACRRLAGRRQKSQVAEGVPADLIKITLEHFCPDFLSILGDLPDPRRLDRITYSKEHLFFLGLFMFQFHCGSRNQLKNERKTPAFIKNILAPSGTSEPQVSSVTAMNYLMENIDVVAPMPWKNCREGCYTN